MDIDMKLPKFAIFDMDGLLFDTERLFMTKNGEVMETYGYHQTEANYIATMGTAGETLRRIVCGFYGDDYPMEEISHKARELEIAHLREHGPSIKPGIPELLDWLAARKIPCCVATSTMAPYPEEFLRLGKIRDYFSFVLTGDDAARSKPAPDIFLKCCTRMGIAPEDAIVFEDSENGVRAAHNGHIPVICIPDMKQPAPEVAALAEAVVTDAFAAIRLLEEAAQA